MQHDVLTPPADASAEPNVHLTGDRWEASCPACGYVLAWARAQELLDTLVVRVTDCPICGWPA